MNSLLDSKFAIGAAGAVAVAVGVFGVAWLHGADSPRQSEQQAVAGGSWDGPIGPGMLASAAPGAPALGIESQPIPGPRIAVDSGGHLVPDLALRKLVDSYFDKVPAAQRQARANELRAYLKGQLKQPALADAERIVADYLTYRQLEEELLARARFTQPDPSGLTDDQVKRLLAWQQQRSQLRQRMLGGAVTQAWYEAEDANCSTALADWSTMQQAPGEGQELDSNELRARRVHGAALQEKRNYYAQSCASQIMDGLAARG
jgi:lipase chaperone LimK